MSSKTFPFPTRVSDTNSRSIVDCLGGFVYYEVYRFFDMANHEECDYFETGVSICTTDEGCHDINNYVTLTSTYKISDNTLGDIYKFFTENRNDLDIYIRSEIPKNIYDQTIMMKGFKKFDQMIRRILISEKFIEKA